MDSSEESQQICKKARDSIIKWKSNNPNLALGIGAIVTMDEVIQQLEIGTAGQVVTSTLPTLVDCLTHTYPGSLSVHNACKIYERVLTRTDTENQSDIGPMIKAKSRSIAQSAAQSHNIICKSVNSFLRDGQIILIHSFSHVVANALIEAADQGKRFRVIITESRPECEGYILAAKLKEKNIPVTIIVDSMVAHIMATVDVAIVGAEAVVENGIINKVGTYQLALLAKALNKPLYVLAESFKFSRQFIFHQQDIEDNVTALINYRIEKAESLELEDPVTEIETAALSSSLISPDQDKAKSSAVSPHILRKHIVPLVIPTALCCDKVGDGEYLDHKWDFTPTEFITFIFSDVGILSPSAISDQLFKLWY